jgi:PAS domain S-box-containing protein
VGKTFGMSELPASILQRAEHTADVNPDATVTIVDTNGIVLYLSPNAKRINGVEPAEMVGNHFSKFVDGIDAANLDLKMQDVLLTGESILATRTIISPSGGRQRMRGSARKLVDKDSGKVFIMSVSRRAD